MDYLVRYIVFFISLIYFMGFDEVIAQQNTRPRAREAGIDVGILPTGKWNAITDVEGVRVGHKTVWQGETVRTGVTVILPHGNNLFQEKVPAAIYLGNAYGKLAGYTQVEELGNIETPIALTNTLNVPVAVQALIHYTLQQPGNESVFSVNAVVGETNDSWLNDIRGMHVTEADVISALSAATNGPVEEGSIGAGTGTSCFHFKGGIGTSSRKVPEDFGGYTVGVLVQTNYNGVLTINGAPVGRELEVFPLSEYTKEQRSEGSCMIVVATDAPLSTTNLKRLAKRAVLGLGRTGSSMENGSGDYVIAFSTAYRITDNSGILDSPVAFVSNNKMNTLFMAVVEATEEAVYNSMFKAISVTGRDGHTVEAIPINRVIEICLKYNLLNLQKQLPGAGTRSK
jgi:D-aminopeptidase